MSIKTDIDKVRESAKLSTKASKYRVGSYYVKEGSSPVRLMAIGHHVEYGMHAVVSDPNYSYGLGTLVPINDFDKEYRLVDSGRLRK